jgi:hypothetical protein
LLWNAVEFFLSDELTLIRIFFPDTIPTLIWRDNTNSGVSVYINLNRPEELPLSSFLPMNIKQLSLNAIAEPSDSLAPP